MSTVIMAQCWPLQGMTPAQKAVLISIADNANDDGVGWPSVPYIAMRTCLSERAVQNAIKWLALVGLLSAQERNGRSTVYTVTPAAYSPPQEMRGADKDDTPALNDVTPAANAPTPAAAAPRTVNNHHKNRNRTINNAEEAPIELPAWLPDDVWSDWVTHRKAVKAPLSTRAAELCLRKLDRLRQQGNDPVEVIEQSILSGKWTDLYPVKSELPRSSSPARFDPSAYMNNRYKEAHHDDARTINL
jgi:hypothetical protein